MRPLLSLITTVAVAVGASLLFGVLFGHHGWTREAEVLLAIAIGLVFGRFVFQPRVRHKV